MNARPRSLAPADITELQQLLTRALRLRKPITIGVRFVSLEEMRVLNRTYRKKDRPTDVLSFGVEAFFDAAKNTLTYWGDLAICTDYAKEEAKRRGLALREELLRLLAHGVLHLAGYDHATEEDEYQMFSLQERVIAPML
jgi:probable rRNA maturation factor